MGALRTLAVLLTRAAQMSTMLELVVRELCEQLRALNARVDALERKVQDLFDTVRGCPGFLNEDDML